MKYSVISDQTNTKSVPIRFSELSNGDIFRMSNSHEAIIYMKEEELHVVVEGANYRDYMPNAVRVDTGEHFFIDSNTSVSVYMKEIAFYDDCFCDANHIIN